MRARGRSRVIRKANVSYCTNCGTQETDGQRFCPVCGAQRYGASSTPMPPLNGDDAAGEAEVRVGVSLDPPRHSRWSVLVRGVLALPLFIVAEVIGIAAAFVTVVAWFAALFTGWVPKGAQSFLTNSLRLFGNLLAYCYFLVPRWPGVNFHSRPSEQVTLDIDHVRLRRWSVFFRLLLGYPANLVSVLFTLGSLPVLVLMWAWAIVVGHEPRPLHQALALVLRFQLRLQAYGCVLTPTQPFRGIFGDGAASLMSPTESATLPVVGVSPTGDDSVERLPTRWFVAKSTRVVLVVILVLGAVIYALNFYVERPLVTRLQAFVARIIVTSSYDTTVDALVRFEVAVARCSPARYNGCVARAATTARDQLAPALATMSESALVPPDALARMRRYESAFTSIERELSIVQNTASVERQRTVIRAQLPTTYANFGADYRRLLDVLTR